MNYDEILSLPITNSDAGDVKNIKGYLHALMHTLWSEGEGFNGKRPFGNGGWEYDLYLPLVKAGVVEGEVDSCGYLDSFDTKMADAMVFKLIGHCFE